MHTSSLHHDEQARVNQAIIQFFDGIAALDIQQIRQCATSDLVILENGMVWQMDTFAAKIEELKAFHPTRTNHLHFITTEINGSTAWVAYNNAADMTINGQPLSMRWLESAFLVKDGDEWKIRLLHSTLLKPQQQQ